MTRSNTSNSEIHTRTTIGGCNSHEGARVRLRHVMRARACSPPSGASGFSFVASFVPSKHVTRRCGVVWCGVVEMLNQCSCSGVAKSKSDPVVVSRSGWLSNFTQLSQPQRHPRCLRGTGGQRVCYLAQGIICVVGVVGVVVQYYRPVA